MQLTEENKKYIDSLSYDDLLSHWRFAAPGNDWFQGETGKYWSEKMNDIRNSPGGNAIHVAASKLAGWDK